MNEKSVNDFGSSSSSSGYHWRGDLAEPIIHDQPRSTTEAKAVESYLATRYGIAVALPAKEWRPAVSMATTR